MSEKTKTPKNPTTPRKGEAKCGCVYSYAGYAVYVCDRHAGKRGE
jgi:hypothetical protein